VEEDCLGVMKCAGIVGWEERGGEDVLEGGCTGYLQVAVCVVRFDLLNTPVLCIMSSFETYVPLSLCCTLIAIVSLQHFPLGHLECPG